MKFGTDIDVHLRMKSDNVDDSLTILLMNTCKANSHLPQLYFVFFSGNRQIKLEWRT